MSVNLGVKVTFPGVIQQLDSCEKRGSRAAPVIPECWPRSRTLAAEDLGGTKCRLSRAGHLCACRTGNDAEGALLVVQKSECVVILLAILFT